MAKAKAKRAKKAAKAKRVAKQTIPIELYYLPTPNGWKISIMLEECELPYKMIPVNPKETVILGEKCYKSLAEIPVPVDIVNVFRASDALPGIAKEAVAVGAKCLWCQFGVINEEGTRIAEAGGMTVIVDRCMKVEYARYLGRMHWLGFNTQRITSVRGGLQ